MLSAHWLDMTTFDFYGQRDVISATASFRVGIGLETKRKTKAGRNVQTTNNNKKKNKKKKKEKKKKKAM